MGPRSARQRLLPASAAFAAALVCALLGAWQIRRMGEKAAWIDAMRARLAEEPAPLVDALPDPEAFAFRRVTAEGVLDLDQTVVLENQLREGVLGVHFLTPLRLRGGGSAVLVDRGFVPHDREAALLASEHGTRAASLIGTVRPVPVRALPDVEAPAQKHWHRVDVAALRRQLPYPLEAVLLVRAADSGEGPPLGGTPVPASSVNHGEYAITWFSFAAVASAIGAWIALRGVTSARAPAGPSTRPAGARK